MEDKKQTPNPTPNIQITWDESEYVQFYNKYGWVHLKNQIPEDIINTIREKGIKLREWVEDKLGQPSDIGLNIHWKGVGCAGLYDEYLLDFYKSDTMYNIASELLNTKDVWMFNDQMVVKLPGDSLSFSKHTDNIFPRLNTVGLCVILDDFTDENGGKLDVYDTIYTPNGFEMKTLYPKKGDIVCIHGNTWHKSNYNTSDKPRGAYVCVYSDERLDHHNYHKTKVR